MARTKSTGRAWRGLVCPVNPEHGAVIGISTPDGDRWHCPHFGHMPRPASHPDGAASMSRHTFTLDEVESGKLAEEVAA